MTDETKLLTEDEENNTEGWLGSHYNEYLVRIRDAVTRISNENEKKHGDLPFYTPHGPDHCQAVENIIHRLIPEKEHYNQLEEQERFYLLASAWLHDLGMMRLVALEIWKKKLSDSEIRKRHHTTAARFITSQFSRCGLHEQDKEILSQICRFHRKQEDINLCAEIFMVGNEPYKLRVLSAYLRLADSLHIDTTRASASAYAICLAYDISTESKLHWIKSKLVNGINIIPDKHLINIEFKIPYIDDNQPKVDLEWTQNKTNYIIKLVLEDLRDELSSVINILTREGITYYLDIDKTKAQVYMDEQTYNDLIELIMNYDIIGAPSASKLLEMILVTISNLAGYHIKKNQKPFKFASDQLTDNSERRNRINDFIKKLGTEILEKRTCHWGLQSLIDDCQNASESSAECMDIFMEKIKWNNLGHIKMRLGYLDEAQHAYEQVLEKAGENKVYQAIAYGNLGNIYQIRGELEKAEEYYLKSLDINKELGRLEGMASDYGNLGNIYQIRGELEKAEEYYFKALDIDKKLGRLEGMAIQYGNLGIIYQIRGELEKAEEYYFKALDIEKKLGRLEGIASEYGNLGIIYQIRGELEKAEEYHLK
ncbi:MAG: tetratricopeptide repeat protein, partial [Candidatus Brocadiaceae bacterium]|nr:tetratricopeptide repeat protein [Candidatus Brocadiaceae bacterium]